MMAYRGFNNFNMISSIIFFMRLSCISISGPLSSRQEQSYSFLIFVSNSNLYKVNIGKLICMFTILGKILECKKINSFCRILLNVTRFILTLV